MKRTELYLSSASRKCINESRACNLAEYGFMLSIDTRLSARNVMKAYNMYDGREGGRGWGGEYSALNLWLSARPEKNCALLLSIFLFSKASSSRFSSFIFLPETRNRLAYP